MVARYLIGLNKNYTIRSSTSCRCDRNNTLWYEINIGEWLAYASGLDGEIDNGIPMLIY